MRVRLSTTLPAPPDWVANQLQSPALLRHVCAPLVTFTPGRGAAWPALWSPGSFEVRMRLLGLLPLGPQTVRIALEPGPATTLRDDGDGWLMRRWSHRITLEPLPDGHTRYTDEVEVVARHLPALMTPVTAVFARVFFQHRQRRWRALAERHAAAGAPPTPAHRRAAFDALLQAFARHPQAPAALRWRWLEAAHVLGQPMVGLHWRSHVAMLRHALRLRDVREASGQLLRLALVPLAHLVQRLPAGNIGRAHVNAWRAMEPAADVAALIEHALQSTALPATAVFPANSGRPGP